MEIAVDPLIPTYGGGLGVLAGDGAKGAADAGVTMVVVTPNYCNGYLKQKTNSGCQEEEPDVWDPTAAKIRRIGTNVRVNLEGRTANITGLEYHLKGARSVVPVNYLDTPFDNVCSWLYSKGKDQVTYDEQRRHRLKQEAVLGIGGVRFLESIDYHPEKYHLNEGHTGFAAVELARRNNWDVEKTKKQCTFTTHTLVPEGHETFKKDLVRDVFRDTELFGFIERMGGQDDEINMTKLCMGLSGSTYAVSRRNAEAARQMFPQFSIGYIDNAVHLPTWVSDPFKNLYNKHIPGWTGVPAKLGDAMSLPDDEVWNAHYENKKMLKDLVEDRTGVSLDANKFTMGWARRMSEYKRPTLPISDINRLVEIGKDKVQLVYAGKAHFADGRGKDAIKTIHDAIKKTKADIPIAFLDNYSIAFSRTLISGVDVWLNTPRPPQEASGTSGMKAADNGVMQYTTIDGWACDVFPQKDGKVGWYFGKEGQSDQQDIQDFYQKLGGTIIPLFYNDRKGWTQVQKGAITLGAHYNMSRWINQHLSGPWRSNEKNPVNIYEAFNNSGFC
jgi:glycogen phosphorylase